MKAVICRVGKSKYALGIEHVISIEKMQPIRELPHSDPYILGITRIRDKIIGIVDLRIWLCVEPTQGIDNQNRIVIIEHDKTQIGLIVDEALDVVDIDTSKWQTLANENNELNKVVEVDGDLILNFDMRNIVEALKEKLSFVEEN